ncbi:MAG: alanine dehydrogenase [Desulfobulbaceae bacterium]|nr:alanine dehydrogenase [Desulfobulbaceae bacterium]
MTINLSITLQKLALVKEIESLENPRGLERRVALVPDDIGKLTAAGVTVYVESGAGEGVGFSDEEYADNGAILQGAEQIYRDKDILIKFKGPAMESIPQMKESCTLLCMAHFNSFPERAQLLRDHRINVIAMEEILESPKIQTDEQILARTGMKEALKGSIADKSIGNLRVFVIGHNDRLASAIRRACNRNPCSLEILQSNITFAEVTETGENTLYFYDSSAFNYTDGLINNLKESGSHLFDLHTFELKDGKEAIAAYRQSHPPHEFGLRRIQCLHETGMAGARYGIKLLSENKPERSLAGAKVVVLGYGNVARGAMHELYQNGVKVIHVLGCSQTDKERIEHWLKDVDLVVNGADLPVHLRGVMYLITNDHIKRVVPPGSVVIDLVSGSETNRSAVEPVLGATFLTEPYFIRDGVTVSSLWGWPMMGMNRESTLRYSAQIVEVLIGREKLLNGLTALAPGVQRAVACGPFND